MPQPVTQTQLAPHKYNELILVVKRIHLFPDGDFQGIKSIKFDSYLDIINQHCEFHPRGLMEEDETFKQIIPYLVFKHGDRYFLMQRDSKASEARLQSKFSLGIGGHIRKEDMQEKNIFDWAKREFHEEINYSGNLTIKPLGILNDDSNAVGRVHIGFVFLLEGDCGDISIKSEMQSGKLMTLAECGEYEDRLETWSGMVYQFLALPRASRKASQG